MTHNEARRHTGKVKWFSQQKGYGFLLADDPALNNGNDIFVHITALKKAGFDTVEEGQIVSFTLGQNRGKVCAENIEADY